MTPRVKYEGPRMAAEFTPISQRHVQPILRPARVLVRVDPGYLPFLASELPTRVRADIPVSPRAENAPMLVPPVVHDRGAWPCVDCGEPFEQRAWNHVRCVACGVLHRRSVDRQRKTTTITRKAAPRNSGRRRVA